MGLKIEIFSINVRAFNKILLVFKGLEHIILGWKVLTGI